MTQQELNLVVNFDDNYVYKKKPWGHQLRVFHFMKDMANIGLFPTMGAGKTKMYLDWLYYKWSKGEVENLLLFAPNGIQEQWENEQLPEHYPGKYLSLVWEGGKIATKKYTSILESFCSFKCQKSALKIFIVNTEIMSTGKKFQEILTFFLNQNEKIAIVIDEVTSIKNMGSNVTKRFLQLSRHKNIVSRCSITGTEVTESPTDLYPIINFTYPGFFKEDFESFKDKYCIETIKENPSTGKSFRANIGDKETRFLKYYFKAIRHKVKIKDKSGNYTEVEWNFSMVARRTMISIGDVMYLYKLWEKSGYDDKWEIPKYKYLDELIRRISPIVISISEDELDLPEDVMEVVNLNMPEEIARIYKDLKEELFAEYKDSELDVANRISLLVRLQQVTGGFFPIKKEKGEKKEKPIRIDENTKLNFLLSDLVSIPKGDKVIIWARFVAEIELLEKELSSKFKGKVTTYYGGISNEQKEENKRLFNDENSGIDIIIINPQSGAKGLNLQVANWNYLYSIDFSLEKYLQLIKRTKRPGQKKETVFFKKLCYKSTIDELIYKSLSCKKEVHDYFRNARELKHMI